MGQGSRETARRAIIRRLVVSKAVRREEKPWGFELIWAETELYVGKLLHVRAGEALSVQYHERKDETLHLLKGSMVLRMGDSLETFGPVTFEPGDSVRMRPGVIHQMEAVTDCEVLEVSTPHLDDLVRLSDRYGRASGSSPSWPGGE